MTRATQAVAPRQWFVDVSGCDPVGTVMLNLPISVEAYERLFKETINR